MLDENISIYQLSIGCKIEKLAEKIQCLVSDTVKRFKITYRVKDSETLRRKILLKKAKNVFSIHDVYAVRVIVESVEDAYLIFEKIKEQFPICLTYDFIKNPVVLFDPGFEGQSFKCLRFIAYKNKVPFEIQITTTAFHEVNESHHEVYHKKRYCV